MNRDEAAKIKGTIEARFTKALSGLGMKNLSVSMRPNGKWTIEGENEETIRAAASWLVHHGLMQLEGIESDEELGLTFAYLHNSGRTA
jgi:hypothetical protein